MLLSELSVLKHQLAESTNKYNPTALNMCLPCMFNFHPISVFSDMSKITLLKVFPKKINNKCTELKLKTEIP